MRTSRLSLTVAFLNLTLQSMAQTTAFTYHAGSPANGSYDFRFTIYNAASDGSAISGSVTNDATTVSNGLFTVRLVTSGAGMTLDGQPILSGTVSSGQVTDGASLTDILDDDGPGSGLNTDLLDGLDSTAFASASHNHFGESWVGTASTGLRVTTTSSAPSSVVGILGRQGAGVGFVLGTPSGVWGDAQTGNGVLGTTAAPNQHGVFGSHSHSNGVGNGVFGGTSSTAGRGVTGSAGATSGSTFGVYGEVQSPGGVGVYGKHDAGTGTAAGVQGDTDSTAANAVGVLGQVTSTAPGGNSAGVRGASTSGPGVARGQQHRKSVRGSQRH